MNKILHLTLFLGVVSALAGGALAFANDLTAPVIAKNKEIAEKKVLLEMYPEASNEDFVAVDAKIDSKTIGKIYEYKDFYIFNMSVSGYKDGTNFLVSLNKDTQEIDSYKAISNGDTKGIGSKVTEPAFADGLAGKDAAGDLDTISGATVSSSPVVEGIHEAAKVAAKLK